MQIEGDINIDKGIGQLTFLPGGKTVTLKAGSKINTASHGRERCWIGKKQGYGLIDGKGTDYLVNDLFYNKLAPNLVQYA